MFILNHQIKNNPESFEQLVLPLEGELYRLCFGMMRNREDAEDCAQEALLKAFRSFSRFRGDAAFYTWLYRIAVNTCLDALRKRKTATSLEEMEEQGTEIASDRGDPFQGLEESERKRLLKEGIALLPEDMRTVLVLRDIMRKSIEETAEILALPAGTVKSRLSRAREKLMKILNENAELFVQTGVQKDERREIK